MWKRFKKLFEARDLDYDYLCGAIDTCDLERRIKQIDKGVAPHQMRAGFASKLFVLR